MSTGELAGCAGCDRLRARAARERQARLEAEVIAERYARDALHDPLTGLANRTLLLDRLELALTRASRTGAQVGVLFLDLDGFKSVNDRLGHGAGDLLLIEMGRRLSGALRGSDLAARQGGDEFVLLCEDVRDEDSLLKLAGHVAAVASEPFLLNGTSETVTASIGVRIATGGERADVVLRDADFAMYEGKSSGGSRWVVFDTTLRALATRRGELETELRRAVEADEFVNWYQPVLDVRTGHVTGSEALVRWQHPVRGLVPPDDFIPAAEESGVIRAIGAGVLARACAYAVTRDYAGQERVMHVNTSSNELASHGFAAAVEATLAATGLPPSALCLEITERKVVDAHPLVQDNLAILRALGVQLAIDDFGTEYASFDYLRRLPVDVVKIDRSFVTNVADIPRDAALIAGIVAMARALGVRTVAEGVETDAQAKVLSDAGVDEAQGYLSGRPAPADAWPRQRVQPAELATTDA